MKARGVEIPARRVADGIAEAQQILRLELAAGDLLEIPWAAGEAPKVVLDPAGQRLMIWRDPPPPQGRH
jgi:hypothetical protein